MQTIIPHLWFNKEANEAAQFYTSIFPESKITNTTVLHNTPSGDCDVVSFELWNQKFMAISAGPLFTFNTSTSFIINFDPLFFGSASDPAQAALQKIDAVWDQLVDGGTVLMPIGEYPFSQRYGWLKDKYGLSWQLMLGKPTGDPRPPIIPTLIFANNNWGKAEEAINFYLSVFNDAKAGILVRYPDGMKPDKEGTVMFADCMLENYWFGLMDSARANNADFNEAISFVVSVADQRELDYYWQQLSADPKNEQCGWLKDKYGLSWQVSPALMEEMMTNGSQEQIDRLIQALIPMKKLDIAKLKQAYDGK